MISRRSVIGIIIICGLLLIQVELFGSTEKEHCLVSLGKFNINDSTESGFSLRNLPFDLGNRYPSGKLPFHFKGEMVLVESLKEALNLIEGPGKILSKHADEIGVGYITIRNWLTGVRPPLTKHIVTISKIHKSLGIDVNELLALRFLGLEKGMKDDYTLSKEFAQSERTLSDETFAMVLPAVMAFEREIRTNLKSGGDIPKVIKRQKISWNLHNNQIDLRLPKRALNMVSFLKPGRQNPLALKSENFRLSAFINAFDPKDVIVVLCVRDKYRKNERDLLIAIGNKVEVLAEVPIDTRYHMISVSEEMEGLFRRANVISNPFKEYESRNIYVENNVLGKMVLPPLHVSNYILVGKRKFTLPSINDSDTWSILGEHLRVIRPKIGSVKVESTEPIVLVEVVNDEYGKKVPYRDRFGRMNYLFIDPMDGDKKGRKISFYSSLQSTETGKPLPESKMEPLFTIDYEGSIFSLSDNRISRTFFASIVARHADSKLVAVGSRPPGRHGRISKFFHFGKGFMGAGSSAFHGLIDRSLTPTGIMYDVEGLRVTNEGDFEFGDKSIPVRDFLKKSNGIIINSKGNEIDGVILKELLRIARIDDDLFWLEGLTTKDNRPVFIKASIGANLSFPIMQAERLGINADASLMEAIRNARTNSKGERQYTLETDTEPILLLFRERHQKPARWTKVRPVILEIK